ncbi:MAG TPA: sigma-70 family RNA polymerase sigma factor [Planctomycetota bacterium]|jgi:RNA polymerase sigma-70 factor (ECF subfamily)|nr:sigma-70 family RNA polymerase sigma factor [Planctomycetota bacterium]
MPRPPFPVNPEVLLAHGRFVRGIARSLLFDEHRVEDVVQQTWLAALENGPCEEGRVRPWLGRVARNFALLLGRREGRRRGREEAAARPELVPSAEEIASREATRRAVVEAVLGLPEPCRSAVLLRFYEEMPPREIARRLGVPVETIRTRVKRGLHLLRERLGHAYGENRNAWCLALVPLAAPVRTAPLGRVPVPDGTAPALLAVPAGKVGLGAAAALVAFLAVRPAAVPEGAGVGPTGPLLSDSSTPAREDAPAGDRAGAARRPAGLETAALPDGAPAEPAPRLLALAGRAVDAEDGKPLPDLTLEVSGPAGEVCSVRTDAEGNFRTGELFHAGVAVFRHSPDPGHSRFQFRQGVEPNQVLLPPIDPGTGSPREEVVFRVSAPEQAVAARVLRPDGAPAPNARVLLLDFDADEARWPERVRAAEAGEDGLARFAVERGGSASGPLKLFADDLERGWSSDVVEVPRDWRAGRDAPVPLFLQEGAGLRARALDETGRPVQGVRVQVVWGVLRNPHESTSRYWLTDSAGEVAIAGLAPGFHRVEFDDARRREEIVRGVWKSGNEVRHAREVVLERGRETTVEFRFPPGETELAVAGTVLDEKGAPLQGQYLSVRKEGEEEEWGARTDSAGAFELWFRPVPRLTIRPSRELDSDRVEPEEVTVPFGTRDLVFRRTAVIEPRRVSFRVVEAGTGAAVEGAEIWLVDPRRDEDDSRGRTGRDGSVRVEFKPRKGLLWGAWAPGFLDREGRVEDLPLRDPAPFVQVALRRGFDRRFLIYDGFSQEPVPGARIRDAETGLELAVADEGGRVRLTGLPVPRTLEVSAAGYRAKTWQLVQRLSWLDDGIPLPRTRRRE